MKFQIFLILFLGMAIPCFSQESTQAKPTIYNDDAEVTAKISNLKDKSAVLLGKFKVSPADATKYYYTFNNGPGRRDYGNNMAYAADRGTALYCGANHGSPHRLNDVWEFHLGSNTWNLICPPGNNATQKREWDNKAGKAREAIKKGVDVEKNQEFLNKEYAEFSKAWWEKCIVEDGYLQDKLNGGPVQPWHTWDGITYDLKTKRLYWAVLDSDNSKNPNNRVQISMVKNYAEVLGKNADELLAQLKPGSSMFMYDVEKKRWSRQLGAAPFPYMRGMGGSLIYLPDFDKTIWYCCAQNVPENDMAMWSYDSKTNAWTDLKPNNGKSIADMTFGPYVNGKRDPTQTSTPGDELQMRYSTKDKKLVAVKDEKTFVYVVATNVWSRVSDNLGFCHDSKSVFAYDSNADVFILISKPGGLWSKQPWTLCVYSLSQNKWENVEIVGDQLKQDTENEPQAYCGYYDPGYNAMVLYNGRNSTTWVYRHKTK